MRSHLSISPWWGAVDRCSDAATAVVTAHDDVVDVERLHRELQHRHQVHVGVDHEVGDVAMDEHLTAADADHLVGVHPTVGAPDEQVLGMLPGGEAFEVFGVLSEFVGIPLAVVLEQLVVTRGAHLASLPHDCQDIRWDIDSANLSNHAE